LRCIRLPEKEKREKKLVVVLAFAVVCFSGIASCGQAVEHQVRQRVEHKVQQGKQKVEDKVQQGKQRVEKEAQKGKQHLQGQKAKKGPGQQLKKARKQVQKQSGKGRSRPRMGPGHLEKDAPALFVALSQAPRLSVTDFASWT
jgi:signal transduction histidine kinase